MKNSSLDIEPPSKFEREKEVSRKKSGTLNQLILSLKNEKYKSRSINTRKNLEKQIRLNWQDYLFNADYLKTNNSVAEETSTATTKAVEFRSVLDTNKNQVISEFNYSQRRNNTGFTEKKISSFYDINSQYSFTPRIREEEKREDLSAQPKKQETKETTYILYNFEEEKEQEN